MVEEQTVSRGIAPLLSRLRMIEVIDSLVSISFNKEECANLREVLEDMASELDRLYVLERVFNQIRDEENI